MPIPGRPLPRTYYRSRKGDFACADVTYLRQDFSVIEHVAKPDKWPDWQRFDCVVRSRELTPEAAAVQRQKPRKAPLAFSPQHNAVHFALRELTGKDAGETSAEWREVLRAKDAP